MQTHNETTYHYFKGVPRNVNKFYIRSQKNETINWFTGLKGKLKPVRFSENIKGKVYEKLEKEFLLS